MGLLFFKNIPFSRKLQSGFGHWCATRRPPRPSPLRPCHPYEVTSKIKADLNIWYLDDGCIGADPQTVLTNATMIRESYPRLAWRLITQNMSYSLSITQTSTSPKQASSFKTNSHPSLYLTPFIGSYWGLPCTWNPPHYT